MGLQNKVLEKYPDLEINNTFFLDNRDSDYKLKALSIDDIAKLSTLSREDGFIAYQQIINSGVCYTNYNEMVKYIAFNNPLFLRKLVQTTTTDYLVYTEYARLYQSNDFSLKFFSEVHKANLTNLDKSVYEADINLFNEILIAQKLYKEGKLTFCEIDLFKDFYFEFIKRKVNYNYSIKRVKRDADFDKYVKQCTEALLEGKINVYNFYTSMNGMDTLFNLMSSFKFGITLNCNDIPIDVFGPIKAKPIKMILAQYKNLYNDDIDRSHVKAIIKMVAYLGINNTMQVISHMPNKQSRDYLFDCFNEIDLQSVKTSDGNIVYNEDFIKFFMGSNIKEPTNLFNKIQNLETKLGYHLQSIYTYWDELDRRYKKQDLETRLAFLENAFRQSKVFLNPDEYKLEGEIINSFYDNTQFQYLPKDEMVMEIRDVYSKMKHNFSKSIPYVCGEVNGISYETLKANDPLLLEMGNVCGCCFKIGGDADSFVKYCAYDKNARVICFKKDNQIIGMSPIIRNGNMIVCNSVEKGYNFSNYCFYALKEASKQIVDISQNSESESEMIRGVLIGNYKNEFEKMDIYEKTALKINTRPLDENVYANMGFDYDTYKVYVTYEDEYELREFEPKATYLDPREEVKDSEKDLIDDDIKKMVNSIYYEKNGKILNEDVFDQISYISYNDDWFSLTTETGELISAYVGKDPRGFDEYSDALETYKEFSNHTR